MGAPVRWVARVLGYAPTTAVVVGVLWAVGLGTRSLAAGPGGWLAEQVGVGARPLAAGRWWTPLTSMLWCAGPMSYAVTTALVVVLCGAAERRFGGTRMLAIMVAGHVIGAVAAVATRVDTGSVAVGPAGAAVGVGLALSCAYPLAWRRCVRAGLLLPLALFVWYSGQLADVVRLGAALCGLALGRLVVGGDQAGPPRVPSRRELRLLLAVVAGGSTIASVVYCVGPASIAVAAVLVLAAGLRQGRPAALWGMVVVNATFAALGILAFDGLVTSVPAVAVIILLLRHRAAFARPAPAPSDDRPDAGQARAMLLHWGSTSMAYMTMWRGNAYWCSPDGQVLIAYRRVGKVALTVGEPIGPPAAIPAAIDAFAEFCAGQRWTPCLYCVGAGTAAGWHTVQIAEDTRLDLPTLAFTGRKWQDVRTALSKARRTGMTAEWYAYRHAPAAVVDQLRAISAAWLRDKGVPEMTFTLGGLDELADDAVRCLAAVDAGGDVVAFTSWLPVYRDGAVIGWTLDLMRRGHAAGNGVMEFLIATAALRFQAEGARVLSLSGAPLARSQGPSGALEGLLDLAGRAIEPLYGFASLHGFKAKFQPTREPLYLAVPDPLALPSVTVAIVRAYLPALTVRGALRMARVTDTPADRYVYTTAP